MIARAELPRNLWTEKDLDAAIVKLCKLYGWRRYHTYRSKHSPAGFPDLVLVRDRILLRELKGDQGTLTAEQKEWGIAITEAGGDFAVWRPRDLEEIARALAPR